MQADHQRVNEYICLSVTPFPVFVAGKKYRAYKNLNELGEILSYIVYDDENKKWMFADSNSFIGFHRYFKIPIKDLRKKKLNRLNNL